MYFGAHVKSSGGVWNAIDNGVEHRLRGDPVLRRQPAHLGADALQGEGRGAASARRAPRPPSASSSSTPST